MDNQLKMKELKKVNDDLDMLIRESYKKDKCYSIALKDNIPSILFEYVVLKRKNIKWTPENFINNFKRDKIKDMIISESINSEENDLTTFTMFKEFVLKYKEAFELKPSIIYYFRDFLTYYESEESREDIERVGCEETFENILTTYFLKCYDLKSGKIIDEYYDGCYDGLDKLGYYDEIDNYTNDDFENVEPQEETYYYKYSLGKNY